MPREYTYKPIALIQPWWYTITWVICCREGGRGRVRAAVAVLLKARAAAVLGYAIALTCTVIAY